MKNLLMANALGDGMRLAALLTLPDILKMMANHESESVEVLGERDSVATCEVYPLQEVDHLGGRAIEIRLLASDGTRELYAYLYLPIKNNGV
jgi:hypothetical protein